MFDQPFLPGSLRLITMAFVSEAHSLLMKIQDWGERSQPEAPCLEKSQFVFPNAKR